MSLRINHNTGSLNAHKNLLKHEKRISQSLERLSSGLAINRAGDAPASLVASEQMRSQIASLEQAVKNSETSVSMVQTAEGALAEVNNMLVSMRQLAIHAANEGANDSVMLEADQLEIAGMISAIDRISQVTEFGSRKLLDGSNGVSGEATGAGLEFINATVKTNSSSEKGFDVVITEEATRTSLSGTVALTQEMINAGETLTLTEGGRKATYVTKSTDTVDSAITNLAVAAEKAGLLLDIGHNAGVIEIMHKKYGSEYGFEVSSSTANVLSTDPGSLTSAVRGQDLKGTINGESTLGRGDTMTGLEGNPTTDGVTVRYRRPDGQPPLAAGTPVGKVAVSQNALTFQVGPGVGQTVTVSLQNMSGNQLARGVDNLSGFKNLGELDVRNSQGAQDALMLIDKAVRQVSTVRAELGSFQKNTLESNIATLRTTQENMIAAESAIRDTDMALELAAFTRGELMSQAATAMMAQANQSPRKVLKLLME